MTEDTTAVGVRATAMGAWPADDFMEASEAILGELDPPNIAFIPVLAARGVGADLTARTAALLPELSLQTEPYGWRVASGKTHSFRNASQWLRDDTDMFLQAFRSRERVGAQPLKIELAGPLQLCVQVRLRSGERILRDAGARRDIFAAYAEGVQSYISQLGAALASLDQGAQGAQEAIRQEMVVQVNEPAIDRVLAGSVPTSSGYRTYRALSIDEVSGAWSTLHSAVASAHSAVSAHLCLNTAGLNFPAIPWAALERSHLDSLMCEVPLPGAPAEQWEKLAAFIDRGGIWFATAVDPSHERSVSELARALSGTWSGLGFGKGQADQLVVSTQAGMSQLSQAQAVKTLGAVREVGRALSEILFH